MTKQEKDTYLRCLGYTVKTYRLRRGMTQELFLRHEHDNNIKKMPPPTLKVNGGKSRGIKKLRAEKGRELKASQYI